MERVFVNTKRGKNHSAKAVHMKAEGKMGELSPNISVTSVNISGFSSAKAKIVK